jgi:hypothetical protein
LEEQIRRRRKIAMTGTPRDRDLGEAQQEIHRRLMRQEKLKRIEEEEMRRLAAMGWKPPIERTTAVGGSSMQDAADAIEVTERKRRAFAQEAQRRAQDAGGGATDISGEESTDNPGLRHNNWFDSSGSSFNPAAWERAGTVDSKRSSFTFTGGDRVAGQASSIAGQIPTNQFWWTARAEGLEADGSLQAGIATKEWFEPVQYSSGLTGGGTPNAFVLKAQFQAPLYRWTVTMPPQESAHRNAGSPTLLVYKSRSP